MDVVGEGPKAAGLLFSSPLPCQPDIMAEVSPERNRLFRLMVLVPLLKFQFVISED